MEFMNGPSQIAQNYLNVGVGKTNYSTAKTFVLAIMAGAFIALGGLGSAIVSYGQPAATARMMSGAVFPVGLLLVLCAGGELFTGNSLLLIPLLEKRIVLKDVIRNWIAVYFGNLVGALLVSVMVVYSNTLDIVPGLSSGIVTTASAKISLSFHAGLIKGILCNFLVTLAVWVAFGAQEMAGKILALYLPIFLFVICGFEHCIANMFFIPTGILSSMYYGNTAFDYRPWLDFVVRNLIPVTIGNLIGGGVFVGIVYWGTYLKKKK